jgi:thiol-disulfide isomerase/thioredoxin
MKHAVIFLAALLALLAVKFADADYVPANEPTVYRAYLVGPIGSINFDIELVPTDDGKVIGTLISGGQRVEATSTAVDNQTINLKFDYYDAEISATVVPQDRISATTFYPSSIPRGVRLEGEWSKRRSQSETTRMRIVLYPSIEGHRGCFPGGPFWRPDRKLDVVQTRRATIRFSKEADPAVLEVRTDGASDDKVIGTILTTTGDYRAMSGRIDGAYLILSTFDAGHAILFVGTINPDGTLSGEFSSGPTYTDTWTGKWDDNAALPDPFSLTKFTGTVEALDALTFPDPEGTPRRIGDFAGKARIIELWGTWCPNCKDAAPVLAELHERYAAKGLTILGLAFEATGDGERDRRQVALYKQRFNIPYPSLIAGTRAKDVAAKAFPMLDQIRAYPSFIFIDGKGEIRGVYTGFTGPAAPNEHERLKRAFDQKVREMLGE